MRLGYGPTDAIIRHRSEMVFVEMQTQQGVVIGSKAGNAAYLPLMANALPVISIRAWPAEQYGGKSSATLAEMRLIHLTLVGVDGEEILTNVPLRRLVPSGQARRETFVIRPQRINSLRSYLVPVQAIANRVVALEFIFA